MSHAQERTYPGFAPEPLEDAALSMLHTGMRAGELRSLGRHERMKEAIKLPADAVIHSFRWN